jgi:tRNA(Ile)-lysidine synthase
MPLLEPTLSFLKRHALTGARGVVAVSGGPDSVALAHVLVRILKQGDLAGLVFAHVNHRLRGTDSDADERFVQSLPDLWHARDVPVFTQQADVAAFAQSEKMNLEEAGRRIRYAYFGEIARQTGAAWVATGHSADDQAETVLLRLLRGAGIKGLCAIPAVRPLEGNILLVRPWLDVRRAQVLAYLAQHQTAYREDASNQDPRFLRNRVRRDLLPLLEQYQPAFKDLLCRLAAQARESQDLLDALAEDLGQRAERPRAGAVLVFDAAILAGAAPIVAREMFRRVWTREGWPQGDMTAADWTRLVELASDTGTAHDLPGGVHVVRMGRVLQLRRAENAA